MSHQNHSQSEEFVEIDENDLKHLGQFSSLPLVTSNKRSLNENYDDDYDNPGPSNKVDH
jgi:hypothetical protein